MKIKAGLGAQTQTKAKSVEKAPTPVANTAPPNSELDLYRPESKGGSAPQDRESGTFVGQESNRVSSLVASLADAYAPAEVKKSESRTNDDLFSTERADRALKAEGGSLQAGPSERAKELAAGGPNSVERNQERSITDENLPKWKKDIADYSNRHYGDQDTQKDPSKRWQLDAENIVLHYTASEKFPVNLTNSLKYHRHDIIEGKIGKIFEDQGKSPEEVEKLKKKWHPGQFKGESPGLSVHYVVGDDPRSKDVGNQTWQLLPDDIRSRGALGFNHRGLNIEMIGKDAGDISTQNDTIKDTASLVWDLMHKHNIPIDKVVSHENIGLSMFGKEAGPSHPDALGPNYKQDPRFIPGAIDHVGKGPYAKLDPGRQNARLIKEMLLIWANKYPRS